MSKIAVSLFVRLWVEMPLHQHFSGKLWSASSWGCELKYSSKMKLNRILKSASSWGCELKYWELLLSLKEYRQPLREAVSWNAAFAASFVASAVSLFVRLWVEICARIEDELSKIVSLFVRLWVEISQGRQMCDQLNRQPLREAVSWNIKKRRRVYMKIGQPLREAVSWNIPLSIIEQCSSVSLFVRLWVEMPF